MKLGWLVSQLVDVDLGLWETQQRIVGWADMELTDLEAMGYEKLKAEVLTLRDLSADKEHARRAIDQLIQEIATPPRQGRWVTGYSQFEEHLDIDEAIRGMDHGYACEIGAADGVSLSNTKQLEDRGWDVLCIEANPDFEPYLVRSRKNVMMVACGAKNEKEADFHIFEVEPNVYQALSSLKPDTKRPVYRDMEEKLTIKVPVWTLDRCLEEAGFPWLDVLSIDVEGGEADVLDGFDIARWKPKIIVLEDWVGGRFHRRMKKAGYMFKRRTGVNESFIHV